MLFSEADSITLKIKLLSIAYNIYSYLFFIGFSFVSLPFLSGGNIEIIAFRKTWEWHCEDINIKQTIYIYKYSDYVCFSSVFWKKIYLQYSASLWHSVSVMYLKQVFDWMGLNEWLFKLRNFSHKSVEPWLLFCIYYCMTWQVKSDNDSWPCKIINIREFDY